tara:strand:+ start:329 stop:592 length:264 start_codon:yes stop_codon:yes gene_type:complete
MFIIGFVFKSEFHGFGATEFRELLQQIPDELLSDPHIILYLHHQHLKLLPFDLCPISDLMEVLWVFGEELKVFFEKVAEILPAPPFY